MFENADWASPFGYYYNNINNFKRKENGSNRRNSK